MAAFDAHNWQRLSPHLDRLFSLAESNRERALAEIRGRDGPLADELAALLAEHQAAVAGGFLDGDAARSLRPPARGPFEPGTVLAGRYRVVALIAAGGMGEVYEADDLELGSRIALKTIRTDLAANEALRARFRREIQLARAITHANVCRIFDLGLHGGGAGVAPTMFLTMELLRGETLAERIARAGPVSADEAEVLVPQLLAALGAAHAAGVVHRDFKSANVMLVPERERLRVVVTDFGIAKSVGTSRSTGHSTDQVVGTPAYMAPEQLAGGPTTPAVDVWAFGVVLCELLTGRRPFGVAAGPPATGPRLPAALDARWGAVVRRCLQWAPTDRYGSVGEIAAELRVARPARRRALYLVPVLGLAGGFAVASWQPTTEAPPPVAPARAKRTEVRLEIVDRSGSASAAWLAGALAQLLAAELARHDGLRVTLGAGQPRADAAQVAELALGADFLVNGFSLALDSASRSDVLLSLAVEDVRNARTVETVNEQGSQADLPALIARVAAQLRRALGVAAVASPAPDRPPSLPLPREERDPGPATLESKPQRRGVRVGKASGPAPIPPVAGPDGGRGPDGGEGEVGTSPASKAAPARRWLRPEPW